GMMNIPSFMENKAQANIEKNQKKVLNPITGEMMTMPENNWYEKNAQLLQMAGYKQRGGQQNLYPSDNIFNQNQYVRDDMNAPVMGLPENYLNNINTVSGGMDFTQSLNNTYPITFNEQMAQEEESDLVTQQGQFELD